MEMDTKLGIRSHFLLYLTQDTYEHYVYKVFFLVLKMDNNFVILNGTFCLSSCFWLYVENQVKFYTNTTYLKFVIFFVVFETFDYRFKMFYIFVCGRGDCIQGIHNQTINLPFEVSKTLQRLFETFADGGLLYLWSISSLTDAIVLFLISMCGKSWQDEVSSWSKNSISRR